MDPAHGPENGRLDGIVNLLSTVCLELCKLNSRNGSTSNVISFNNEARLHGTSAANSTSWQSPSPDHYDLHDPSLSRPRKRRRLDSCGNPNIELDLPLKDMLNASSSLPPPELLGNIVNAYFTNIHPWIPILHETRFRARMLDPDQRPLLIVIIHAMVVAAIRFARPEAHGLSAADIEPRTTRSRSIVVLTAMDSLSVENLQALIIIAFNDVTTVSFVVTVLDANCDVDWQWKHF